ncbi:MAG: helix-hairpin-helix domain-containing protein [bacterium]|nr:helix-hairpin-helix domain-containing protein [bacterium]
MTMHVPLPNVLRAALLTCSVAVCLWCGAAEQQMVTVTNVWYVDHAANDGDSFWALMNGTTQALRLYFVDAPESSASALTVRRVREQMRYFGHSNAAQTVMCGQRAAAFTTKQLAQPFTVQTVYASALGSTAGGRIYAFVTCADGRDLGELLVRKGLASARGVGRETPDKIARDERAAQLQDLELAAALKRAGVWHLADADRIAAMRAAERQDVRALQEIQASMRTNVARISLNTAARAELLQLKGIGEKRAAAIIKARPYHSVSNLFAVPGVPRALAQEILPHVSL